MGGVYLLLLLLVVEVTGWGLYSEGSGVAPHVKSMGNIRERVG
jgi:hypothetical protein